MTGYRLLRRAGGNVGIGDEVVLRPFTSGVCIFHCQQRHIQTDACKINHGGELLIFHVCCAVVTSTGRSREVELNSKSSNPISRIYSPLVIMCISPAATTMHHTDADVLQLTSTRETQNVFETFLVGRSNIHKHLCDASTSVPRQYSGAQSRDGVGLVAADTALLFVVKLHSIHQKLPPIRHRVKIGCIRSISHHSPRLWDKLHDIQESGGTGYNFCAGSPLPKTLYRYLAVFRLVYN